MRIQYDNMVISNNKENNFGTYFLLNKLSL